MERSDSHKLPWQRRLTRVVRPDGRFIAEPIDIPRFSRCFHVRSHLKHVSMHRTTSILRTSRKIGDMAAVSPRVSKIARAYLWSILIWLSLSPVNAGEDAVTLRDQGMFPSYWVLLLTN